MGNPAPGYGLTDVLSRYEDQKVKYRLTIFDFDGTLADTFTWFTRALEVVAKRFGLRRVEKSEVAGLRSYDAKRLLEFLGVPFWKVPMIANYGRALMARDLHRVRLFEGAEVLLRQLREEGTTLAIVSSNSRENIGRVLGPETESLVTHYECGVSIFGKPAKLKRVIRKSGCLPEQAIFIGDEIRDLQAAQRAGIAFGAVGWGYNSLESLEARAPAEVFQHLADIAERLGVG